MNRVPDDTRTHPQEAAFRYEQEGTLRFVRAVSVVLLVGAPFFTIEYFSVGIRWLAIVNSLGMLGAAMALALSFVTALQDAARITITLTAAVVAASVGIHGGPEGYDFLFLFTLPPAMAYLGGLQVGSMVNIGFIALLLFSLLRPDLVRWARAGDPTFNARLVSSYLALNAYVLLVIMQRRRAYSMFRGYAMRESVTGLRRASLLGLALRVRNSCGYLIVVDEVDLLYSRFGLSTVTTLQADIARRLSERFGDEAVYHYKEFQFLILGSCEAAADTVETIRRSMREPFPVRDMVMAVRVRIAATDQAYGSSSAMLRQLRLTAGQNAPASTDEMPVRWYSAEIGATVDRREQLGDALERALSCGTELSLAYQPIVEDGRTVGWEALARWDAADYGPVGPDEFIPIAERRGLIPRLTDWALRTAWAALDDPECYVAVNLSSVYLSLPNPSERIANLVASHGIDPSRVVLEVTETALVQDLDRTARSLQRLREAGFRIAIDDFGTGYAGLQYLRNFPADIVKIDRSYVDRISAEDRNRSIVAATVTMAQSLGMGLIAEGVESPDDLAVLQRLAIQRYQGFLFARPGPVMKQVAPTT